MPQFFHLAVLAAIAVVFPSPARPAWGAAPDATPRTMPSIGIGPMTGAGRLGTLGDLREARDTRAAEETQTPASPTVPDSLREPVGLQGIQDAPPSRMGDSSATSAASTRPARTSADFLPPAGTIGGTDLHDLTTAGDSLGSREARATLASSPPSESAGLSPMEIGMGVLAILSAAAAGVIAWRRRA